MKNQNHLNQQDMGPRRDRSSLVGAKFVGAKGSIVKLAWKTQRIEDDSNVNANTDQIIFI